MNTILEVRDLRLRRGDRTVLSGTTAVINSEASTAIMAMTVNNSTSVNAAARGAATPAGRASSELCARIGTMNLEQVRRHGQGAAGILPAVLFSDWYAGKMPAALWGGFMARKSFAAGRRDTRHRC